MVGHHMGAKKSQPWEEEGNKTGSKIGTDKPPTLFHSIERSQLPPQEKSAARLQQEGATMLFAGSETTARLLCHTVFHLLDNPDILRQIREEVLKAVGDSKRIPDLRTLEKLPWLVSLRTLWIIPPPPLHTCCLTCYVL